MVASEDIHAAVDARENDLVEFLQAFIGIETENPPGRNYPESVDFLADAMDKRGYDVERVPVPEKVVAEHYSERTDHERVNILGRKDGNSDGEGPDIHFTGHFDVVPTGKDWTRNPYDPVVEDGLLYGRGASDMKSGIAASLFAIDALEATGVDLSGSVTQSMTCDEETGGFTGLGYLVDEGYISQENTDYCVYTECFGSSRVCLGHRGVLKFRVVTHGEKAHGCMAHDGENAMLAMNDFLTRVREYRETLHNRRTDLPVTPEASKHADISPTMADAGYSENVIPDRCTATFYRVLVPEESIESAKEEIHNLMDETEAETGMQVEYDEIMFAEPTSMPADCTSSEMVMKHASVFHDNTEFVVSPGSDDQRFVVNDADVECIVYGPGLLEQAHVVDEHVPVEEVTTATKVMATATADLMGILE